MADRQRTETERELPTGWAWTTVGDVTLPIVKVDPTTKPNEAFDYIDIASIDNGIQQIVEPKRYSGRDAPSRARQLLQAHDVVFSTVRTYLKNIALVPARYDGQIASTGFSVLRAGDAVMPQYIFYYSLTPGFLNTLAELQRGTSYPAVRDSDVREQPIPLAPLPEQRRIVAKIEELFTDLDAGVAALKRVQATLKRYKASVLKAACEGRLVPQDASDEPADKLLARILAERRAKWEADQRTKGKDPKKAKYEEPQLPDTDGLPELPDGWCLVSLQAITDPIRTITYGILKPGPYIDDGIPMLRIVDLAGGKVDLSSVHCVSKALSEEYSRTVLHGGECLISLVGTIGLVAIAPDAAKGANLHRNVGMIVPLPGITSDYLWTYLSSPIGQSLIRDMTTGANQPLLNVGDLKNMVVAIPNHGAQIRIVGEVERRLSVVAELEKTVADNLARAGRLRQAILHRAFSGRLVPQDPNDEPAEKLLERIRAEKESGKVPVQGQLFEASSHERKPAKGQTRRGKVPSPKVSSRLKAKKGTT